MIDALMYAIRDGTRAAKIGYGIAECELMDGPEPPPRCGNFFVSIHDGAERSDADNQLNKMYSFSVTLTMRVTLSRDRVGDQQIYRNINRVPLAQRQGFKAKTDQLSALLHMNWGFVVLTGQSPNSANDNLAAWTTGTVYGFCEPMRYRSIEKPTLVGADWFESDPTDDRCGIKATMTFDGCRRFQPFGVEPHVMQTAGPFI